MGLVLFAFVGALIGWLVAAIQEVDEGVLARIGIGALGAMLGMLVTMIFKGHAAITQFSWLGIILSIIGAVALLAVTNRSSSYEPRDTA